MKKTTLNNLKIAVKKENQKRLKESLFYYNEKKSLNEKEKYILNYYYNKSLERVYKKASAKTENQKNHCLIDLLKKSYEKELNNKIKKIENAEKILDNNIKIEKIKIFIKWIKSHTWGYNPHCTIDFFINDNGQSRRETYTGKASGCGYDKRSASTQQAFNQCDVLIAYLYLKENERLKKRDTKARRDFIGYGSGYSAIPYFEGGVGFESHDEILKNLGFKRVYINQSMDDIDIYEYEANKK